MVWEYLTLQAAWAWNKSVTVQGQPKQVVGWLVELVGRDPLVGLGEICNAVGRDGWELVSAIPMTGHSAVSTSAFVANDARGRTTDAITLFFKRPLG